MEQPKNQRFQLIDVWRGLALIAMAIYHFAFIFYFGGLINSPYLGSPHFEPALETLGWFARLSFVFLVGLSGELSFSKRKSQQSFWQTWLHFFRRGLIVIFCGLIISLGSYLFLPDYYVRFGILHFIGSSLIILPFFLRSKNLTIFAIISFTVISNFIDFHLTPNWLTISLGVSAGFNTVDYFRFIQWLPLVLLGSLFGKTILKYPHLQSFCLKFKNKLTKPLIYLGQHSLPLYFIHIITIVLLVGLIKLVKN